MNNQERNVCIAACVKAGLFQMYDLSPYDRVRHDVEEREKYRKGKGFLNQTDMNLAGYTVDSFPERRPDRELQPGEKVVNPWLQVVRIHGKRKD